MDFTSFSSKLDSFSRLETALVYISLNFELRSCLDFIVFDILKIASKLKKRVVIGTTGFNQKEENIIKNYSKKIPILKAGNMSLGVNLLMYLTEIASKSLHDEYLSKVYEVHHKYKKDLSLIHI